MFTAVNTIPFKFSIQKLFTDDIFICYFYISNIFDTENYNVQKNCLV